MANPKFHLPLYFWKRCFWKGGFPPCSCSRPGAPWNPCCLGEKLGHFRDVSQCSVGGHLFIHSFIHSLDIEPWLWVIAQGIWDPGREEGLGPLPPMEYLASLSPPGPLFIYPKGPKFQRSIPVSFFY